MAVALNNVAQAVRFEGRYAEAEPLYRRALEIWESALGPWHPDVAAGLGNLADFYHERGREAGAETLYRRALAIEEKVFGPDSPQAAVTAANLAQVCHARGRNSESEKLYRRSLAVLERSFGPDDRRVQRVWIDYAALLGPAGRRGRGGKAQAEGLVKACATRTLCRTEDALHQRLKARLRPQRIVGGVHLEGDHRQFPPGAPPLQPVERRARSRPAPRAPARSRRRQRSGVRRARATPPARHARGPAARPSRTSGPARLKCWAGLPPACGPSAAFPPPPRSAPVARRRAPSKRKP